MRPAYHFMIPRPPVPELDGAVQEALWLRQGFGGPIDYLYPAGRFRRWIPARWCGVRQLAELRALDRQVDLHHVFSPGVHAYPVFRRLRRPLVYTLLTGLDGPVRLRGGRFWRRVAEVVAPDSGTADLLVGSGLAEVSVIPPGIDLDELSAVPEPPAGDEFVLLAGSAPWSVGQFASKGYDLLLDVASELPRLRLVLLWRGTLKREIQQRVARRALEGRVEIVDETVNVAEVLGRAHAAVALAQRPRLLKAFPHSLLEALAAGRPVVTSAGLAIAGLVQDTGGGVVVDRLDRSSLRAALERLMSDYVDLRRRAAAVDLGRFSRREFLGAYERVYRRALAAPEAG